MKPSRALLTRFAVRPLLVWGMAVALSLTALVTQAGTTASAAAPIIIAVPCHEIDLENALTTANATGATLYLKAGCTYGLTDVDNIGNNGANGLPVVTNQITINARAPPSTPTARHRSSVSSKSKAAATCDGESTRSPRGLLVLSELPNAHRRVLAVLTFLRS